MGNIAGITASSNVITILKNFLFWVHFYKVNQLQRKFVDLGHAVKCAKHIANI